MDHARKQLFFCREALYHRKHALYATQHMRIHGYMYYLNANKQHIHALIIIIRRNKVVLKIRELILSTKLSRRCPHMNAGTHNELPQEHKVPTWLLPCTCGAQRYHCNAGLKLDILCVIGHYTTIPRQKP